jgi:hypothetical protein
MAKPATDSADSAAPATAPAPAVRTAARDFRPDNPAAGAPAATAPSRPVRIIKDAGSGVGDLVDTAEGNWGRMVHVLLVTPARVLGYDPEMRTAEGTGGHRWLRGGEKCYMPEDSFFAHPFVGKLEDENGNFVDVASKEGHAWRVFDAQAKRIVDEAMAAVRKAPRESVNTAAPDADLAASTVKP